MKYDDYDMYAINFSKINAMATMELDVDNVELSGCTYSMTLLCFILTNARSWYIHISVLLFLSRIFLLSYFYFYSRTFSVWRQKLSKTWQNRRTLNFKYIKMFHYIFFGCILQYSSYNLLIYSQKRISEREKVFS